MTRALIAIHSCDVDSWNGRYDAIMDTWGRRAQLFADLIFFKGAGLPRGNEVVLDCYDGKDNLIEKEQAMFRWVEENTDYEKILKTETDVYFNIPAVFSVDYGDVDVVGRMIGEKFGEPYADSSFKTFFQGHAMWYSRKALKLVGDRLVDYYTEYSPKAHFRPGTLDPGLRSADLWGAQILTEAWMRGEIKVMNEMGFAGGPLSYHFQGNDERKATTPAWMRGMEKTHGRH